MKTNKEKNQAHAAAAEKMRPKQPVYDFSGLEAVIRQWAKGSE